MLEALRAPEVLRWEAAGRVIFGRRLGPAFGGGFERLPLVYAERRGDGVHHPATWGRSVYVIPDLCTSALERSGHE